MSKTLAAKTAAAKVANVANGATEKTPRKQISKLIGINLSVSRVRKHVDKININADVESALAELKQMLHAETEGKKVDQKKLSKETQRMVVLAYSSVYDVRKAKYTNKKNTLTKSKNAADKKKLKDLEPFPAKTNSLAEKVDYVSKLKCRFSTDAPVVLSSALDYVVQGLVRSAMVNAKLIGKSIIQVCHVVQGDFCDLDVYPLVKNLPVVQDAVSAANGGVADVDADADDADVADDAKGSSTFEFYINLICRNVKEQLVAKDEMYNSIRISKYIRKFCSNVVVQLISDLSPLITLYRESAKVKTVNDEVIKFVFAFILKRAGVDATDFHAFLTARLKAFRKISAK